MADDADAKLVVEADVPAFLKDVDEMAEGAKTRFTKLGVSLKTALTGGIPVSDSAWAKTPSSRETKDYDTRLKLARELIKTERDRRQLQRAERYERNRMLYGDDAELTEAGDLRRARRNPRLQRGLHYATTAVSATHSLVNSGFSNAGMAQFGGAAAQAFATALAPELGPMFGPLISAITSVAVSAFQKQDIFRNAGLTRYQAGGLMGLDADEKGSLAGSLRKGLGFNIGEFSQMYGQLAKQTGDIDTTSMADVMRGERAFGIGSNMTNLLGAGARTGTSQFGNKGAQSDSGMIGAAMGLALSENVGRGRMGELFDQLATSINENTKAVTDVSSTADRLLFISQLGPQYKGNTGAAREMNRSFQDLAQGNQPYTMMTMLGAAGFGQPGVSYAEAWLKSQKGLDTTGGLKSEDVIRNNFASYIPQYRAGSKSQRASIVLTLSKLTGMNGAQIESIMERLSQRSSMDHLNIETGQRAFGAYANTPAKLLRPKVEQAAGEDMWRVGIGDARSDSPRKADIGALTDAPTGTMAQGGSPSTSNEGLQQYQASGGRFGINRPDTARHPGEDLFFPPNTTVYSPCDGTVTAVGLLEKKNENAGAYVWVVDDQNGRTWRLVHLNPKSIAVKTNQRVKKGTLIGKTLPFEAWKGGVKTHLHVGVTDSKGELVDPMSLDDLKSVVDPKLFNTGTKARSGGVEAAPSSGGAGGVSVASSSGPSNSSTSLGVKVDIQVHDRTRGGIDVSKEVKKNVAEAKRPAPGDVPAHGPSHE